MEEAQKERYLTGSAPVKALFLEGRREESERGKRQVQEREKYWAMGAQDLLSKGKEKGKESGNLLLKGSFHRMRGQDAVRAQVFLTCWSGF